MLDPLNQIVAKRTVATAGTWIAVVTELKSAAFAALERSFAKAANVGRLAEVAKGRLWQLVVGWIIQSAETTAGAGVRRGWWFVDHRIFPVSASRTVGITMIGLSFRIWLFDINEALSSIPIKSGVRTAGRFIKHNV